MMSLGNALLIRRMFTVTAFRIFRTLYIGLQRLYWELSGTGRQLQAHRPENYDRCAQVLNLICTHKLCDLQNTAYEDLICTHVEFVSPQYIIDNDHITLMFINDDYAVFSEAPEKGMCLWSSEYSSFVRMAHRNYTRVIRVPMPAFHRMAETIGDPKAQIVFLFNVARCGSTLFTQIMEHTGRCVTLSEPIAPNAVTHLYGKQGDTPQLRQLARDVIRWECRPYTSMKQPPLAYVIKLTAPSVGLPLFKSVFPDCKCLFMYRDLIIASKSLYRIAFVLLSLRLAYILGRLSENLLEAIMNSMGLSGKEFRLPLTNDLSFGVLCYSIAFRMYLDLRSQDPSIVALRYEDLVGNPLETCWTVLEYLGLPASLAPLAVKGLEADSQRNSPLARKFIGRIKEPELGPGDREALNEILARFGLPNIGMDPILEGTLAVGA